MHIIKKSANIKPIESKLPFTLMDCNLKATKIFVFTMTSQKTGKKIEIDFTFN